MRKAREASSDQHQWEAIATSDLPGESSTARDRQESSHGRGLSAILECRQSGLRQGGNGMRSIMGDQYSDLPFSCPPICWCLTRMDKVKARDEGWSVECGAGWMRTESLRWRRQMDKASWRCLIFCKNCQFKEPTLLLLCTSQHWVIVLSFMVSDSHVIHASY